MASLGRSMSLQVNTGNKLNTSQPQSTQAGSLFSTASSQPQSSSLFGGSTAQSGGLFGGSGGTSRPTLTLSSITTSSQPQSGGLFGSAAATSQPQTGGLFGGSMAASSQQSKPSLFGSLGATTTSAPVSGGLFGGATSTSGQTGSSLFGGTLAGQQQQTGSSLFGGLGAKSTGTSAPSLFSTTTTTGASSGPGLFGSLLGGSSSTTQQQQQHQPKPFGSTLFSTTTSQQQQQQQTIPGVKIDWSNIKPTTRFSDLHEDIQKQLCIIEDFIQGQISFCTQINAATNSTRELVQSLPGDAKYLEDREETVELAVERDARDVKMAKEVTRRDAEDAKLSFAAVENLKLPSQFHYQPGGWPSAGYQSAFAQPAPGVEEGDEGAVGGASAADLIAYFSAKVAGLQSRLNTLTKQVSELEAHMGTVEYSAIEQIQRLLSRGKDGDGRREQMADLVGALRGVEDAIVRVASKVGEVREEVVALQFPDGARV